MAAKLKSIIRQIHWSLVIRAVVFLAAWLFTPFWLFLLVALYCYFVPLFQAGKFAVPFFVLIILAYFEHPGWFMALIFAGLFYYLLLIKDLLLIDRKSAQALLTMALSFFLFREFYSGFREGSIGFALIVAFLVALLFALLLDNFIFSTGVASPLRRMIGFLVVVLMSQWLIIGLFLPLDFIYQSVIIFLAGVVLIDFIPEYLSGNLSLTKIRATSVVIFSLLTIVLASARWGL